MEKVVADKRDKSERTMADDLLAELSKKQKAMKKSSERSKEIQEELLVLAEKHPEWFDGKTAKLENGELKWVASSVPVIPDTVDLDLLGEKYPSLVVVKRNIPITALRTFLNDDVHGKELREAGLDIETTDRFSAKPN